MGGRKQLQGVPRAASTCPGARSGTGSARVAVICQGKGAAAGGARDHRESVSKQGGDERAELETGTQPRLSQGTSTEGEPRWKKLRAAAPETHASRNHCGEHENSQVGLGRSREGCCFELKASRATVPTAWALPNKELHRCSALMKLQWTRSATSNRTAC